jgi:dienelactone hydrolase
VTIGSVDAGGTTWRNRLSLRTSSEGSLRVPMRAITGMQPQGATLETAYVWSTAAPARFAVTVTAGRRTARTTFRRPLAPGPLRTRDLSFAHDQLVGTYVAPAGTHGRPAVLLLGGSEGGVSAYGSYIATHLAAHGFPVLQLAYFAAPGLPGDLARIPLEYFARGLSWLDRQPEVDRSRVDVFGISRGSEAAQLVALHWPGLVHAVVLAVPTDKVGWCFGYTCNSPAWTFAGRPVTPFRKIPAERILGSVFALCAADDELWPSCPSSRALLARRRAAGVGAGDVLVVGAHATHTMSGYVPYEIHAADLNDTHADANEAADEVAWPKLLSFLQRRST